MPIFDIYILCIYIYYITLRASDKYVKAYISGFSRRYSGTVTMYSWQIETSKPYCNIEFLSNIFSNYPRWIKQYSLTRGNEFWDVFYECKVCDTCSLCVCSYVVYAASCCSHRPCYDETARCRNIKYSSLTRFPPFVILLHLEVQEIITVSIYFHGTYFKWWYKSPLQTSIFKHFNSNFPVKILKNGHIYPMAYGWFMFGI